MQNNQKILLIALTSLVACIYIYHTVSNKVTWPFCPHNFYYHRSELIKPIFQVKLQDYKGKEVLVNCRHTLPIEGYHCGSIYREVFIDNNDTGHKKAFAELVLSRLNSGGWQGFDERFYPVLPKKGRNYVNLVVEKHYFDMRHYGKTGKLPIVRIEKIYEYNPM